jgi:Fe-S oxidoreductase
MPGLKLAEMERVRENGFCCGGGGRNSKFLFCAVQERTLKQEGMGK